ncbi:MAG: hypothetical protein ABSB97_00545 [Thermoplasmata archaeon]
MAEMSRQLSNPAYYGLAFLLAFALSVVMLVTDKNLQTNFGTVSNYYAHWYVVLGTAIVDLVGAALLLALRSRTVYKVGVVGSGLLAVLLVGDIATYSQVGFSSASSFANYLFGVTYYGGNIRYLYDVLLAVYIATFLWGVASLALTRGSPRAEAGAASGNVFKS